MFETRTESAAWYSSTSSMSLHSWSRLSDPPSCCLSPDVNYFCGLRSWTVQATRCWFDPTLGYHHWCANSARFRPPLHHRELPGPPHNILERYRRIPSLPVSALSHWSIPRAEMVVQRDNRGTMRRLDLLALLCIAHRLSRGVDLLATKP